MLSFMSLTASLAQGNVLSISRIIILILGLLVAMVALCIMAPRLGIPYPVALVLGGLLLGFVPGLPGSLWIRTWCSCCFSHRCSTPPHG